MFIEIEQDTGFILEAYSSNAPGRIELTPDQANRIATSKYGHTQFIYADGDLIENLDMLDALDTSKKRISNSMSRMDFILSLDAHGLLDQIVEFVNDPATPRSIKLMWEHATSFHRMNPEVLSVAQQLGITESQIDSVFGI